MTNAETMTERRSVGSLRLGPVSCRIDGRAGYLELFDDQLNLIRSGRRGGAEPIVAHDINSITTTHTGRLFTTVKIGYLAAGSGADALVELKFPAADALRIIALIQRIAESAEPPGPVDKPWAAADEPWVAADEPWAAADERASPPGAQATVFSMPAPVAAAPTVEVPELSSSFFDVPPVEVPEVRMPEWTPLPEEVCAPDVSDVPDRPAAPESAAAPPVPGAEAPDPVLSFAPADAEPDLDAEPEPEPEPEPQPRAQQHERPARPELSEELANRLNRLEVLRNCGIMSEADYRAAEAEIVELAGS